MSAQESNAWRESSKLKRSTWHDFSATTVVSSTSF